MFKKIIILIIFLFQFVLLLYPAARTWNVAGPANWNIPGNWLEGAVPVAGDDVIINNGGTVNLNVGTYSTANALLSLTINNGTLNTNNNVLSVSTGNLTIGAAGVLNGGAGAAVINVNSNVVTSGTLTGWVDVNFNFTVNGGTTTLVGATNWITGNFAVNAGTFNNNSTTYLRFDDTAATINSGGSNMQRISINNAKTLTSNFTCTTLSIENASSLITSSFNLTCSSLTLISAATLNASGQTAANTLQVNGNAVFNTANTGTLTGGAGDITITGNLNINNVTGSTGTTYVGGGTVTLNTFISNGGTLNLNGAAQAFTTNNQALNNLTISSGAGSVTTTGQVNVSGDLTVNGGDTLNCAANNSRINITGNVTCNGTITSGTQQVNIGGNLTETGAGTFTAGSGNVDINGFITLNNFTASTNQTYIGGNYNVTTLTATGGTVNFDTTNGSAITTNGQTFINVVIAANKSLSGNLNCTALTINTGCTFTINGNNITASASISNDGTLIRYASANVNRSDSDTGLVIYQGVGGAIQTYAGNDYYNLEIDSAGETFTSGAMDIMNDLTITSGTLDIAGNTVNITGALSNNGTLRRNAGNLCNRTDNNSGTIVYYGAGGNIQDYFAAGTNDYNILEIQGGSTFTAASALDIAANLNITAGELSIGANTLTVNGSINANGQTLTAAAGTINVSANWDVGTFNHGNNLVNFFNNGYVNQNTGFYDLTISSGTRAFGNPTANALTVTVAHDFSIITGGSLDARSDTIRVGHDWVHTGAGTFTNTGSTVDFNNTGSIQNSESFNNITISAGNRSIISSQTILGSWNCSAVFIHNNQTVIFSGTSIVTPQDITSGAQPFYNLTISKPANSIVRLLDNITIVNDFIFNPAAANAGIFDVNQRASVIIGRDFLVYGGEFTDNSGGAGMNGTTTITVARNFDAIGTNSPVNFHGRAAGSPWKFYVTPTGSNHAVVQSGAGGSVSAQYADSDISATLSLTIQSGMADFPTTYPPATIDTCINWDRYLRPYITNTRARIGNSRLYVEFSEDVYDGIVGTPLDNTGNNFVYNSGTLTLTSLAVITNSRFFLQLSGIASETELLNDSLNCSSVNPIINGFTAQVYPGFAYWDSQFQPARPQSAVTPAGYRIGIDFFTGVALDTLTGDSNGWGSVSVFDGSSECSGEQIVMKATLNTLIAASAPAVRPRIFFAEIDSRSSAAFWIPPVTSNVQSVTGINAGGDNWIFPFDPSVKFTNGKILAMVFEFNGWYCYRPLYAANSAAQFHECETFMVKIKKISVQNNNTTILNNVINPNKGDVTKLMYTIDKSGPVSIVVYDLNSDIVKVLESSNQSSGTYTVTWDGTNSNRKIVARGVYFIRVRAPGIFNQIRKVLIIK